MFCIKPLDRLNKRFDNRILGDVEREALLPRFESKERTAAQFIEHQTEALAFTHAAGGSTNQAGYPRHRHASIRRQTLQENAQNRSPYHKFIPLKFLKNQKRRNEKTIRANLLFYLKFLRNVRVETLPQADSSGKFRVF